MAVEMAVYFILVSVVKELYIKCVTKHLLRVQEFVFDAWLDNQNVECLLWLRKLR